MIFGQDHSCVEVLIDPVQRRWRTEVIDHVFEKAEAKIIKSIPLSSTCQPDAVIWPFTPSGRYSVQSGYRFLQDNSVSVQSPVHDSAFWKNLWRMEVPSKVKNFVWRACKEALPTKKNLLRRRVTTSALCENCNEIEEDCAHAIFYCPNVQVAWSSDPLWSWLSALQGCNVQEIFQKAFEEKKDAELLAFAG